jgi:TonB family protein
MNKGLSPAILITALIIGLIGLLNVVLGLVAVKSGAFPSAEGRLITPAIGVGSIVFGLVMLAAGALWITSSAGYFTLKEWASTLALYISPIIVAINLVGVLGLWGFDVHIGWAALSTVVGVGSICYISRKELASFFLISVVEHVGVIAIFAILIYGEPVEIAESTDREIVVTIEEIKQEEPLPLEIIPRERTLLDKTPTLPKMEIQSVTVTEPGVEIEDAVPQLPETLAQVARNGEDMVLKSPGREPIDRRDDTLPPLDVQSVVNSSKKPSLEVGPAERVKGGTEGTIVRSPEFARDDSSLSDERLGPSDEVARPSFAGDITGEIVGRKVVFWPRQRQEYRGTKAGSVIIKFWVDPAGNVTRVKISKKSGSPTLDRMASEYVEGIRFEELPKGSQQITQWGEIPINFELTRNTG